MFENQSKDSFFINTNTASQKWAKVDNVKRYIYTFVIKCIKGIFATGVSGWLYTVIVQTVDVVSELYLSLAL